MALASHKYEVADATFCGSRGLSLSLLAGESGTESSTLDALHRPHVKSVCVPVVWGFLRALERRLRPDSEKGSRKHQTENIVRKTKAGHPFFSLLRASVCACLYSAEERESGFDRLCVKNCGPAVIYGAKSEWR